jgi:arylsulfatase A
MVESSQGKPQQQPNIILIMADDMGYECVNANGGTSYQTPHLDKLAETGIRFEHCYSQPLCTPSRVKIMTGKSNARNYVSFGVLDRKQTTFAHLLKKAGYATCIVGKWQLGKEADSPQHFGFDESCLWQHTRPARDQHGRDTRYPNPHVEVNGKPLDYSDDEYGPDVVTDFLCDFMERNKDKSFLAYYPMILPHNPFVPTPDSENPKNSNKTHNFRDMVTYVDKMVGKLDAKLGELGIRNNTLLIFTCDNGTNKAISSQLGGKEILGGKGTMTDAGTRVPLIISWPGTTLSTSAISCPPSVRRRVQVSRRYSPSMAEAFCPSCAAKRAIPGTRSIAGTPVAEERESSGRATNATNSTRMASFMTSAQIPRKKPHSRICHPRPNKSAHSCNKLSVNTKMHVPLREPQRGKRSRPLCCLAE